jgi:hypothetical protein
MSSGATTCPHSGLNTITDLLLLLYRWSIVYMAHMHPLIQPGNK